MSDKSKSKRKPKVDDGPKTGDAAWRAARDEIAQRNEQASKRAQARRQEKYERLIAAGVAEDKRERAELAKLETGRR